jgi:uncharacterized protein (DUF58 family)
VILGTIAVAFACAPGAPWLETAAFTGAALLAAATLADLAIGPRSSVLQIERQSPEHFSMRVDAELRYEVSNRGNLFARVGIVETPIRTLFFVDDDVCADVPPRHRATLARRVTPVARGRERLGDLHVWYENPLGLLRRRKRVAAPEEIRVYPDLSAVERYGRLDVRNRFVEVGLRRIRMLGTGTEFESLREYATGDAFRSIDWKASARRGRMMVAQYEVERSQSVMLLLDCGRLMTPYVGDQRKLDYAVTAALSLASIAAIASDRVGAAAFAREIITARAPRSTAASLHDLSEAIYDLEPRFQESDYAKAFDFTGRQLRRRSLVVLLTDVVDPIAQSLVLAELAALARRHLVLCLFMNDAAVANELQRAPHNVADAYRLDVALGLSYERRAAAANLERRGIIVVDAPARSLSVALIDQYLRIKQRGLL